MHAGIYCAQAPCRCRRRFGNCPSGSCGVRPHGGFRNFNRRQHRGSTIVSLHLSHPSTAASSPLMRSSAWTTTSAPGSSQPVSYAERLRLATNQRAAAAEKAAASASTASVRTPGAGNGQSLEESASADRAAPAAGRPSPPAEEPSNATEGPSSHAKLAPSDAPVEPATGSAATADPASASTSTAASTPAAPANASASTSSDSPTEATDPPTSKTNIWELRRRQREQQKNSSPESGGKPAVNGQPAASVSYTHLTLPTIYSV